MAVKSRKARERRHRRLRRYINGTSERPRLNVYRSIGHIYAQVIDDVNGHTLASASTVEKALATACSGKTKKEQAALVGKTVAERAVAKDVNVVVFDRGGYLYHGRVKALAEGAREGGLKF